MAKFKPPQRLFKNQEVILPYEDDRRRRVGFKHMTRDHPDVLQNIEFALVTVANEDSGIDDRAIHEALQSSLKRSSADAPDDPRVIAIREILDVFHENRDDVSDTIWDAGLHTIAESVRKHSGLAPGEKSYLSFVSRYVR
jgi:hypothetical protein